MRDLVTCACRELARRRARTAATVFGYVLAVGVLVFTVVFLRAARAASVGILSGTGTHFIAFGPCCTAGGPGMRTGMSPQGEGFVATGVPTNTLPLSLVDDIARLPGVRDASPCILFRFRDPSDGLLFTVGGIRLDGTRAAAANCCGPDDVVSGRFLRPGDGRLVLLDESFAGARGLRVGSMLSVAGRRFTVAGVVNPGVRPARADAYMEFDEAADVVGARLAAAGMRGPLRGEMTAVLVEAKDARSHEDAVRNVRRLLPGMVVSSYNCYQPASRALGVTEGSFWLVAVVVGLSAVLLSLKSQLSSVVERRREIGILKAIGWSDNDILFQVLVESMLQAVGGGMAGCAAAAAALAWLPVARWTGLGDAAALGAGPRTLAWAVVVAALGGVAAGIVPAFAAARQRPVESLRSL